MDPGCYTVVKEANEWTISAGGIRIIACRDRRTALKTVRRAVELLGKDEMTRRGAGPGTRDRRSSRPSAANLDLHDSRTTDPGTRGHDVPDTIALAKSA